MAQFFTDFTEYTPDAAPSDWTQWWNTGAATPTVRDSGIPSGGGAQALEIVQGGSTSRYALTWDEVGALGDIDLELLVKIRTDSIVAGSNNALRASLYVSGSAGGENVYFTTQSDTNFSIATYVNGTGNFVVQENSAGESDQWYWIRLQRTASSNGLRARIWEDGDPEPESWIVDGIDSSLSSGSAGVQSITANETVWVATLGVGTDGDSAPSEPVIGIDSVTPSTFADSDTGVTIAGEGFEASQGTGKVELGDDSDYATATLVEQTVTSWGDTSIGFTVVQGALNSGTVYVFVTNDSGDTTDGFEAHIIHELSATVAGTSTVSAALSVTRSLSAASAGSSEVSAALLAIRQLSAQIDGVSTVSADLVIDEATVELAATIAGQSTVSADLSASFVLSATSAAVSTASADLLAIRGLSAALAGESTFSAELLRIRSLVAAITAQSTVTALLAGGSIVTYVPPGIAQTAKPPSGIAQTAKPPSGIAQTAKPPQPGHARFR